MTAEAKAVASDDGGDRYAAYFHALDSWTEYWDIYRPETRGRFYFGDGKTETGLLTRFLPREKVPPAFLAWKRFALYDDGGAPFREEVARPEVAEAVAGIDELVDGLFVEYFGNASDPRVREDYLEAIHRFATDTLPPADYRDALIPEDDPRKATAGRHTLDGDLMWFAWAMHTEAAQALRCNRGGARRALQMAGIATGCPANFAWRGHRRTRPEYSADRKTAGFLRCRGLIWAGDFNAAADEVRALFRIREWGTE